MPCCQSLEAFSRDHSVTNAFCGRLRTDPLGELQRSPDPLAVIGGGVLLPRGREGKGRGLPPVHSTSGYGLSSVTLTVF